MNNITGAAAPDGGQACDASTLDVCMIVKNEEDNLKKTLPNMVAGCDHVIIVDTGSSDKTKELARSLGAEVHDFQWIDDFAAARNASLSYSKADWVLWLDADEYIEIDDIRKLRDLAGTADADIISLQMHDCLYGTKVSQGFFYREKLFRNISGARFIRQINETVELPGDPKSIKHDGIKIYHWGAFLPGNRIDVKTEQRTKIYENALLSHPDDSNLHYLLGCRYQGTGREDEAIKEFIAAVNGSSSGQMADPKYIKEAAHVKLAQIYLSREDHASSAKEALEALSTNSTILEAYCILAAAHIHLNGHDKAAEILASAVDLPVAAHPLIPHKDHLWTVTRYELYAITLLQLKRYPEAVPYLKKILETTDNHSIRKMLNDLESLFCMLSDIENDAVINGDKPYSLGQVWKTIYPDREQPQRFSVRRAGAFVSRKTQVAPEIFMVDAEHEKGKEHGFIMKSERDDSAPIVKQMLKNEYDALCQMRSWESIKNTVPKPAYFGRLNGKTVLVESFIKGRNMNEHLFSAVSKETIIRHYDIACDWALLLFNASKSRPVRMKEIDKKYFGGERRDFQRDFPLEAKDMEGYFPVMSGNEEVSECALHGDYFVSNFILSENGGLLGMIDFEDFRKISLPAADIINFMITYTLSISRIGANGKMSFADWFPDLLDRTLDRYLEGTGTGKDLKDILFKYAYLMSINREMKPHRDNSDLALMLISKIRSKPANIVEFVKQELML